MRIMRKRAYDEWAGLLSEKLQIKDTNKLSWLSEYSYNHSTFDQAQALNEGFSYPTTAYFSNIGSMGPVTAPANPAGTNAFYTGATGSGDKFPSLLPMALQVANRTIAFDLVPVIPMNGPTGVIAYMDFEYGSGRTDTTEQPMAIKINAGNINALDYVVGSTYWGVSAASGGTFASGVSGVELVFVGYSFYDGHPIFRVGDTYKMVTTTWTVDGTVKISDVFDGSAVIALDDSGEPNATNADTHRVTVSAKAELVKSTEDHIQGPAGAGEYDQDDWAGPMANGLVPVEPMGRGTGESTYYRSLHMKSYTKFVEAKTYQFAASVTTEQIQDMNRQWGMDIMQMVENQLINEISQSINKHILNRLFALGWSNNINVLRSQKITLNLCLDPAVTTSSTSPAYINKVGFGETTTIPPFADMGQFENLSTLQRRIGSRVLAAGNLVNQTGKRGPANFIVTNAILATSFQDSASYSIAPLSNTISQNNGSLYPVGTLAGMTIYVDPNMELTDNRILVGRKGADEEPGLKFCPYLMAETIQTIAENTMSPKIAVKSRYAVIEAGHQPQSVYYTLYVKTGANSLIV